MIRLIGKLRVRFSIGFTHYSLLIAYYPFNGDAQDLSGNGNNGTVYGAVLTSDRWGNPNSAYSFDGVDDFIDIGNNEILKPDFPITICAWVNLSAYGTGNPIFTNNFDHDLCFGIWLNFTVDGLPAVNYGNSGVIGPQSRFTKIGTTHLSLNTWYHIVGIIHDNSNMDLYVNGINDGGFYVGQANQMVYSQGSGNIGRKDASIHNPPTCIAGLVDEIYFYGRALTESEINSLVK